MRIYTNIKELSNDDLRVLSNKTGKSVRELKRLRKTKSYVLYTPEDDSYIFFGYTYYLSTYPYKPLQEFFDYIREYQLSQLL